MITIAGGIILAFFILSFMDEILGIALILVALALGLGVVGVIIALFLYVFSG